MDSREFVDVNRRNWDERARLHARSGHYGIERLLADHKSISDVVAFDRPLLGDIAGLHTIHLQCHIGTDTLSLHRLGALVEGLDFSPAAIDEARRLSDFADVDIPFHLATVDDAVEVLGSERFELVYTGIGALNWLPDVRSWARTVAALLAPGGRLFIREGHPMLGTVDDGPDSPPPASDPPAPVLLAYPYFEQPSPLRFENEHSYVPTDEPLTETVNFEWTHSLGAILQAVLDAGLLIVGFEEQASAPWKFRTDAVEIGDGEWALGDRPERLACTYTLQATKPRR